MNAGRWALIAALLALALSSTLLDSSPRDVTMEDVERGIASGLTGQLLGDARVAGVRCVRRTRTEARCVAELFDKGGDGPILQRVAVAIERDTGEYSWHPRAGY